MNSLSIVIPAFDEGQRIGPSMESILSYIKGSDRRVEVIVVDDGSSDNTIEIVESFIGHFAAANSSLTVLRNPGNRGKGYSIRHGMLAATGGVVLFTDADLSSPISEAEKIIAPIIADQCDVALGSRALAYDQIRVHQSKARECIGRSFNFLMQMITGLEFQDTQCGFKAYRRASVRPIFTRQLIDGFGFDVEALYIAKKLGFRLKEVPVQWSHCDGTKVNWMSGLRTFADLLTVRKNDITGRYSHGNSILAADEAAAKFEQ